MAKKLKPRVMLRKLYVIQWWDAEADAGWGPGAGKPPLVCQPCFIIHWPKKKHTCPSYQVATAFVENTPGGATIIPAAMVKSVEQQGTVVVEYRKGQ